MADRDGALGIVKKIAIVIALIVVAGYFGWRLFGGSAAVVDAVLPRFPVLPTASRSLSVDQSGTLYFESSTPYDFDVILSGAEYALPTTGVGTLILPDDASPQSPVPAMVILHGSGGISPGREMPMGRFLADHGIAAFVVNYYLPRGVTDETNYMLRVISVTEFDAVTDAYAALRLLATHPSIDGDRVGVMGFSYGGMATRFAMDERIRRVLSPERGFAAFADFYGPCFQKLGTTATNGAPLLTLRGTEDASNELTACLAREEEMRALGVEVEAHVFEGAGHAWEADIPREMHEDSPYVAGCTIEYDDAGRSSMAGTPIVDVDPSTPRPERIAIRMQSGSTLRDCVKNGYVIGRDDETRAKAETILLDFLGRSLQSKLERTAGP